MANEKGNTVVDEKVDEKLSTDDIVVKDAETGKPMLRIGPGGKDLPEYARIATEGQIVAAKPIVARQQHGVTLQECVNLSQRTVELAQEKAEMAKQLAAAYASAAKAQEDLGGANLKLARLQMKDMEVENKRLFAQVSLEENRTITDNPEQWDINGFNKGEWFIVDIERHAALHPKKGAENGAG